MQSPVRNAADSQQFEPRLPIAVIGAGPVGLAAAAHLLARGETPLILKAGPVVGHAVRKWGHVRTSGRDALPFVLPIADVDERVRSIEARAVIDASGTWLQPNPAGADGLPAPGETEAADCIAYGIPDVLERDRALHGPGDGRGRERPLRTERTHRAG